LQAFGDCSQSSQIGPHLVQPLRSKPIAMTLKTIAKRLNMACPTRYRRTLRARSRRFQATGLPIGRKCALQWPAIEVGGNRVSEQKTAEFDLDEARCILGDVFAPWVQDLGLSIAGLEISPPPGASADWQPGAILRMAFSERLCRQGGIVCGQALMALADTAMVIAILAANRGFRPMTTVDQTTHFLKAVASSDVLADARVVRLGRTMSFGRVTLFSAADNKPVAMVSSAFAML
jgi:uncharacterized protein (TIGR00369 family)